MSNREAIDIIQEFVDNPHGLYNEPTRLNENEKLGLFEVEEMMVAALLAGRDKYSRVEGTKIPEQDLAVLADAAGAAAAETSSRSNSTETEMGEVLSAKKIMENPSIPTVPLPSVLRKIVSPGEGQKDSSELIPSVILGLASNGIEVIKSTLRGIALQPQAFTYTRSAPTPGVLEKQSRIELHQVFSDAPDIRLEYQIMRESESELMVNIRFLGMRRGTYSVSLMRDKRVIASHNLSDSQNMVTFSRLAAGSYRIEIKGSFNYKFGILIDDLDD